LKEIKHKYGTIDIDTEIIGIRCSTCGIYAHTRSQCQRYVPEKAEQLTHKGCRDCKYNNIVIKTTKNTKYKT